LEVEGRLRESIPVREVMNAVDDVERVGSGSIEIVGRSRWRGGVISVVEHQIWTRLDSYASFGRFVGDDIVSSI